jgi:hypothetical protein
LNPLIERALSLSLFNCETIGFAVAPVQDAGRLHDYERCTAARASKPSISRQPAQCRAKTDTSATAEDHAFRDGDHIAGSAVNHAGIRMRREYSSIPHFSRRRSPCYRPQPLPGWKMGSPGRIFRDGQKNLRSRLLEVRLIPLKPDRWEWQVCEGETLLMVGFETSRETAQIEGNSALFLLLSAGLNR